MRPPAFRAGSRYPKYDMGPAVNLAQVFGRNRWLWLVPVYGGGPDGDGVHWPTNEGGRVSSVGQGSCSRPPPVSSSPADGGCSSACDGLGPAADAKRQPEAELDRSPDGDADCEAGLRTAPAAPGWSASKQFVGGGAPPLATSISTSISTLSGAGPSAASGAGGDIPLEPLPMAS